MKWILFLSLVSTHASGAISIWIPHEKEIWSLIRKAERTPEMKLKLEYPGIEKMTVDRSFEVVTNCGSAPFTRNGMVKITDFVNRTENCTE